MRDGILLLKVNLCECLLESLWLENWVPSEHVLSSWLDDLTLALADEDQGLSLWSLTEGKSALSVRCFVVKVLDHLPQAFSADCSKEVLTTERNKDQSARLVTYI